ncbi:hypothetical protein [Spirillospora sp. NPDC047279]|uniref:hypothetical protein n=1 Tax=Spirillospora sp. NPDC047279 TaxID=3155478 RepID=UPI0033DA0DB3
MSTDRRDLDRDAAERLLRGGAGPSGDPAEPLARLLSAASSSAREDELLGEDAAVTAFLTASPDGSRTGRLPLARRLLTVKIAAVGLAATAAGGVALAAGTGALPVRPGEPATTLTPATPQSESPRSEATAGRAPADRSPAHLQGLCEAYDAARHRMQLLRTPAFAPLVSAAGGVGHVPDYCGKVLKPGDGKHPKKIEPPGKNDPGKKPDTGNGNDAGNGNGAGNGVGNGNRNDQRGDDDGGAKPFGVQKDRANGLHGIVPQPHAPALPGPGGPDGPGADDRSGSPDRWRGGRAPVAAPPPFPF